MSFSVSKQIIYKKSVNVKDIPLKELEDKCAELGITNPMIQIIIKQNKETKPTEPTPIQPDEPANDMKVKKPRKQKVKPLSFD